MSVLEERYRSVLRLLPVAYREVWEEDMVATFLAGATPDDPVEAADVADLGRPGWAEVASVAALAVRLRLGGVEAPPRSFAWGEAVRTVALAALLFHTVTAVIGLGTLLWVTGVLPGPAQPGYDVARPTGWQLVWPVVALAWPASYLAMIGGRWRLGQRLAVVALVPAVVSAVSETALAASLRSLFPLLTTWSALLVTVLLTGALVAFHRDAPPVRRTPWLIALPVGVVVIGSVTLSAWATVAPALPLDWSGLCCVAVVIAAVVHLVGRAVGRVRPDSPWPLALALLLLAVLVLRATSMVDLAWFGGAGTNRGLLLAGAVEGAALLTLGVPLAVLAGRVLRRAAPVTAATRR
jgi:uncharacterized integral membrane protein